MLDIAVNKNESIVLGDSNCGYLWRQDNPDVKHIFCVHGFKQIITEPTGKARDSNTIIDVISTTYYMETVWVTRN